MSDKLVAIGDSDRVSELEALKTQILDSAGKLNKNKIAASGWCAVPVESACHFNARDAHLLARAIAKVGISTCIAAAAEPLTEFPSYFEVEASNEGLLEFSKECAHFNFILTSTSLTFAVNCTVDDYFIVSGPEEFVRYALDCTIAEARARFRKFADDDSFDSDRLNDIAEEYERVLETTSEM